MTLIFCLAFGATFVFGTLYLVRRKQRGYKAMSISEMHSRNMGGKSHLDRTAQALERHRDARKLYRRRHQEGGRDE